jgi:hypothetical protein
MTDDVKFNPDATDGDGDGMVQDGTEFERPVGEMPEGFNPDATDGDGDGMVQDGTEFERPVEEAKDEVITSKSADAVVESAEPTTKDVPGLAPVENGVIGTGKVTKKAPAPKPKKAEKTSTPETVAIFASRNLVWPGFGKITKGYNIVSKEAADQWLTLETVRLAEPSEIKATLG